MSSGSTEGCDDVDELDDDDDEDVSAVTEFNTEPGLNACQQHQQPQRLTNVNRDCAVFMADFVQKILDPS